MSFSTGYRGTVGGAVQTSYTDQPGAGVAGMLAFASDINLVDAVHIGEPDGIAAGRGVVYENVDSTLNHSMQRPDVAAKLPELGTTIDQFKGILVFDERMNSNSNGIPGWADGRVGRVLRNNRSGGRIYVSCPLTVNVGDSVWMQLVADADYQPGEFRPTAGATPANVLAIPNAQWVITTIVPAIVPEVENPPAIAMIELLG